MKKQVFLPVLLIIGFLIFGCSKEDDIPTPEPDPVQEEPEPDPEPDPQVLTGVFKDAEVEGLTFETSTQNGTTNAAGEFSYLEGEEVSFKVGNVVLGSALGQDLITPITLAQKLDASATIESNLAQNIAALIQTLDVDGDDSNGILISSDVANNLGVDAIDFSQPVEAILADIILNVIQNTGIELSIVYPGEAAENLGETLGITYEAPENLVLTYLIPTFKTFFETWDNNYTSTSAIYKTTFDANGDIIALDVLSRYSGKQFFKMDMMTLNALGLPENLMLTTYANNRLTGSFGDSEFTNQMVLQYNAQNQVGSLGFVGDDGSIFNENQFTSYDQNNKPLSFFRDLAPDDPNRDFTISWEFTYENDLIATAKRVFDDLNTDDFPSHFISTREFVYNYNQYNNLSSIRYSRVFDNTYMQGDQQIQDVVEASIEDVFTYDASQKLIEYTENQLFLEDGSTFTTTRNYDQDEQITLVERVTSSGNESTTNFNEGVATSTETFDNGLLTFEEERFADGSRTSINYFYFEGQLVEKQTTEYGPNTILETITFEFYENGSVFYTLVSEYFDGVLATNTGINANGEILFIDTFNDAGFIVQTDFYFEGSINSTQEFSYNENNFVDQVIFKDAEGVIVQVNNYTLDEFGTILFVEVSAVDGTLLFTETWEYDENGVVSQITVDYPDGFRDIYYYEDGILVLGEFYDENGTLYDTIDYTQTGKMPLRSSIDATIRPLRLIDDRVTINFNEVKIRLSDNALRKNIKTSNMERSQVLIRHLKNVEQLKLNKH